MPRQCGTDCTQPVTSIIGLPGGLPWLTLTVRPICAGTWIYGGMLCSALSPSYAYGSWILGSKGGEDVENTMLIASLMENHLLVEANGVVQHLPPWKNEVCHHWRQSQFRTILRWDSATSGNPIIPLPTVLTSTPTQQMLGEEWDTILQQCVTRLVTSMRRRCQAVVAVYGSSACYWGSYLSH